MNGSDNYFAQYGEPYEPAAAASPPPNCQHYYQWVSPQEVQSEPLPNDTYAYDHVMSDAHAMSPYGSFLDREAVAINVDSTYNVGDRSNGWTPQDTERAWALQQPVPSSAFNNVQTAPDQFSSGYDALSPDEVRALLQFLPNDDSGNAPNAVARYHYDFNVFLQAAPPRQEEAAARYQTDDVMNYAPPSDAYTTTSVPNNPQHSFYRAEPLIKPEPGPSPRPATDIPGNEHPLDLTCDKCGNTKCNTLESLKRHKEREHGDNVKTYTCQALGCNYSSKKETDVTRHHDTIHLKKRPFACEVCNKSFTRKDNRDRHTKKCVRPN